MPGLLQLSQEIRDEILRYVILIPIEPPATYEEFEEQERKPSDKYSVFNVHKRVLIEKRPQYGRDIKAVMLANRQLHHEAKLALGRHGRDPTNYLLDIAYLNDATFRPTWLSVPILKPCVDTLLAKFRIVKTPLEAALSLGAQMQYKRGCGGPPKLIWLFQAVLNTCLQGGPLGSKQSELDVAGDADRQFVREHGIAAKKLVIDFVPVTDPDDFLLAPDTTRLSRLSRNYDASEMVSRASEAPCFFKSMVHGSSDATLSPEKLVNAFTERWLACLLSLRGDYRKHGKILYEKLGILEIRLGDELVKVFDIGEMFRNLEFPDDCHPPPGSWRASTLSARQEEFLEWKTKCAEQRRASGLD